MRPIDLREYKNRLRTEVKAWRRALDAEKKAKLDAGVLSNVLKMREYKHCNTVYIYVSTPIEVDTRNIITAALNGGKRVAVPRCIPDTRQMVFHYITGFEDLEPGTFGVLEPFSSLPTAEDFGNSLMLVPAMMIDRYGYRLGYGKGYYDRYISKYHGVTAGLCYLENLKPKLLHGKYDQKLDYFITEKYIRKTMK